MPITEVINNDEVIEGELLEGDELEHDETETGEELSTEEAADDGNEPVVEALVSIEGEESHQEDDAKAPEWVRNLRKSQKELQRENRELKKKLEQSPSKPAVEPVGKKPSLDDFDYDTDRYESALDGWFKRKDAAERAEKEVEESKRTQEQAWQRKVDNYAESKKQLNAPNFDDAESSVFAHLSVTQQGIIIQGADNPAAVIYALDNHPTRLAELAALKDAIPFAVAMAKLETKLKMGTKNAPPAPERRLTSSGSGKQGALDNKLDKLRADAEKTGNYTKLHQYKMEQKKKQG